MKRRVVNLSTDESRVPENVPMLNRQSSVPESGSKGWEGRLIHLGS